MNANDPAFPNNYTLAKNCGLTKREYLSVMAMQGMMGLGMPFTDLALESTRAADALIKALES